MAQIKLTKTELRSQQVRLTQLQRYLPTLQLKKALLQFEVNQTNLQLEQLTIQFKSNEERVFNYAPLLSDKSAPVLFSLSEIREVKKQYENIAGIDIPIFEKVIFEDPYYSFFDTPVWLESATRGIHELIATREKIKVTHERRKALEKELREVSIRVNLFEKIMIPRTVENIKRIKIFLGDQQLAAVSQAKASKRKIMMRKSTSEAKNDYST